MGRGLSRLQKTILVTAYKIQQAEGRSPDTPTGADCYYREALVAHYGWTCQLHQTGDGKRCSPGGHHFSRAAIGERKYNAAMVALNRAVRRLEDRELVEWRCGLYGKWHGVILTTTGTEIARGLLAKQNGISAIA